MELRHLRYALAVAEAGSFTRAAARLHVAQQALSQQVADLERELQVRLFDRTARGATPTDAGLAFLQAARETLLQSERAVSLARNGLAPHGGRLTLGVHVLHHLFERFAIEAIARFREAHPGVEIEAQRVEPTNAFARLRRGTLDLALLHAEPEEEGDLTGGVVWAEPQTGVLLPLGHPLAGKTPLWLRDLLDLPLLTSLRSTANPGADGIFSALAERGLTPRLSPVRLTGSSELVASAVSRGWGWALAVSAMAEVLGEPGVVFREFADPPIPLDLWLVYRHDRPSLLAHGFAKACREGRAALGGNPSTANPEGVVRQDGPDRASSA